MQRMEVFEGTLLVASNLRDNIDAAFARRFESVVRFPVPGAKERLALWRNAISNGDWLPADIDLTRVADKYELTGGAIVNVVRYCVLDMLRNSTATSAPALGAELCCDIRSRENPRPPARNQPTPAHVPAAGARCFPTQRTAHWECAQQYHAPHQTECAGRHVNAVPTSGP